MELDVVASHGSRGSARVKKPGSRGFAATSVTRSATARNVVTVASAPRRAAAGRNAVARRTSARATSYPMSNGAFVFLTKLRFSTESTESTAVVAVHAAEIANAESSGDAFVSFSSATSDCSIPTKHIKACATATCSIS